MTVAVFLALTAGPTAFAQPGRGRFPGANFGFSALDTNHDGVLDDKEIDAATITFAKLDKNADGQITPDEVRAATPEGCRRGGVDSGRSGPEGGSSNDSAEDIVKTLMAFDSNGDGKLSPHGNMTFIRMDPIEAALDANGDGVISAEELRNSAEAIWKLDRDGEGKVSREEAMAWAGRRCGF